MIFNPTPTPCLVSAADLPVEVCPSGNASPDYGIPDLVPPGEHSTDAVPPGNDAVLPGLDTSEVDGHPVQFNIPDVTIGGAYGVFATTNAEEPLNPTANNDTEILNATTATLTAPAAPDPDLVRWTTLTRMAMSSLKREDLISALRARGLACSSSCSKDEMMDHCLIE